MSENDFHDQVLAALSDLNVDLAETNGELKAVVARMDKHRRRHRPTPAGHWQAPGGDCGETSLLPAGHRRERRSDLTAHVTGCPMKAKMDTVEDWMTAMKATADANGYWLNRLWPAFYGAAGVAIYVAAMHANDFLKAMKP